MKIGSGGSSLATPASLTITLAPQTLPTGTYLADIILTPAGAGGVPVVAPVLLLVSDATAVVPNLTSLTFSAAAGGAPQSKTVEVTASPATTFTASASTTSGGSWLSVSPTSASANAGNKPLTITADATSLGAGTYQGFVTLTTAGGVVTTISVTFTVAGGSGPVTISPLRAVDGSRSQPALRPRRPLFRFR